MGNTLIDMTGMRFGKWTVLERDPAKKKGMWVCRCDCGTVKLVSRRHLKDGGSVSCGCFRRDKAREQHRTHGMKKTRLYRIWSGVKDRTSNPKSKYWNHYGGDGITMYEPWKDSFEAFKDWAMANGYSDNLSIDRIDNYKGYSPDNCRWVDFLTQENNRRNTRYCVYQGERFPAMMLARRLNLSRHMTLKLYGE